MKGFVHIYSSLSDNFSLPVLCTFSIDSFAYVPVLSASSISDTTCNSAQNDSGSLIVRLNDNNLTGLSTKHHNHQLLSLADNDIQIIAADKSDSLALFHEFRYDS